ncbi:MAG: hypothetical protein P8Y67_02200 [Alphaproteobacteria bacterium]
MIALCVAGAALGGCSSSYPRLPDLSRMNNILSPKEQDETIKTLTNSQASQDATVAKEEPEGQQ